MAKPTTQQQLVINLVQVLPEFSGGIEVYARELVPRLIDRLDGWRVSALVNSEGFDHYGEWDPRLELIDAGFSWHDGPRRLLAESTTLPRRMRKLAPALIHNMTNTALRKPGAPQISTIFDATQILEPAPGLKSRAFRQLLKASVTRSDLIITISQSAGRDIADAYEASPEKIRVALLAARQPTPGASEAAIDPRIEVPDGAPYFLTPASRRSNKNIAALIRAFAALDDDRALLLLAGADGGKDDEFTQIAEASGVADRVRMLGWVTDAELDALYAHATALVFPSLMEGFGLPVLEAMQVGCAVATSNTSSLPEVGGDAAIYFDPRKETEITEAMARLLSDAALVEQLRARGLERAANFSWERTADETLAAYRELVPGL